MKLHPLDPIPPEQMAGRWVPNPFRAHPDGEGLLGGEIPGGAYRLRFDTGKEAGPFYWSPMRMAWGPYLYWQPSEIFLQEAGAELQSPPT
jgi:hypothetical protein